METCYTTDVMWGKNTGGQVLIQRTGVSLGLVPARPSNSSSLRKSEATFGVRLGPNSTTSKLVPELVVGLLRSPDQKDTYSPKKENNKYLPRKSKLIIDRNTMQSDTPVKLNYELESHTFLPPFFVGSPEDSFMSHLEMRIDSY